MKKSSNSISSWFVTLFKVWRREFRLVFTDLGVVIFFFFLTIMYPLIYTIIYNPETVKNIPVVVVDNSRTSSSRNLARMIDATEAIEVYDYAPDMQAARRIQNEHDAFGILEIPSDYATKLGRGEQAVVTFYSEMSLLLRYRAFVSALTDVQLAAGAEIQQQEIDELGLVGQSVSAPLINSEAIMLGDPTQGFASFIIPGILVLILQQSLILGVTMIAAGGSERRRANGGIDPLAIPAGPATTVIGKTMCYLCIYLPMTLYVVHIVPLIFSLPHIGNVCDYLLFLMPMLIASSFLGITLSVFVTERESSMLVIVFTSVVFLFLSGLTWPRYAMNWFWHTIGDFVPATWGVEGFIRLNSNGAVLAQESHSWAMLWILAVVYFVTAVLVMRFLYPSRRKLEPVQRVS
ncbi:MAG: ABC transporter permease [Bacteroides sp.]|nr:ABC transporter permease [Bacteroides sp.]MCM1413509.1 ABC transporter permease [Bacteroides sp.]MCM1471063.1 ABC transporter permease [Bacteroides sp.]